jgi:outer membrane protein OmpA-like peptidoglycan-associated protein
MTEVHDITAGNARGRNTAIAGRATRKIRNRVKTPAYTLVAAGLVLCTLSACETMQSEDPYTGEKRVNKTTTGAAIGAVGGAVVGAIAGGRKGALIGAGVGALGGGAVGYYMDQQEAKLREQLRGTGVSVTRVGDSIILNMPGNVTFATNSSDISSSFYSVLDSVALVLNEYEKTYVDVIGHTDSVGSEQHNQMLSEQRAASVAKYLESHKVLAQRIIITGKGESNPIASNDTPEGRAMNRRVEITLTPVT